MPTIDQLHERRSQAIFRSHLRKIVEIYDLEWRVLHELIQNAIDATQVDQVKPKGRVEIKLDVAKDKVTVEDNGIGFKNDLNLLVPGGTGAEKRLSSRSPAKGYQGVGLKAVMYSTTRFEIDSQTESERWTFIAEDLGKYIEISDPEVIPEYIEEVKAGAAGEEVETFTKVTATFPDGTLASVLGGLNRFLTDDAVRWKALYDKEKDRLGKQPTEKYLNHFLSWYFRTRTYVGCVNSLLNIPVENVETGDLESQKPVDIRIVFLRDGLEEVEAPLGDWLRFSETESLAISIPYRYWDYSEIIQENKALEQKYRIVPDLVTMRPDDADWEKFAPTFREKFLELKLTPNEKADSFREKYQSIISLLERPRAKATAEDFEDVLTRITGVYLAIGRTSHFETLGLTRGGLKLIASNGTPTAHDLIVSSTSSTWYLETMHLVINVDETLNVGKRHLVNPRLVGRLKDFFQACYPKLVWMSQYFVERSNRGGNLQIGLPEVLKQRKIKRDGIPFRRFPIDENSLLGIFSAAMAKLDPEFSIYGLFSRAIYDGRFLWREGDPRSEKDLFTVEFKVRLDDLLNEFDVATHDKTFADLQLIVVWDRRHSRPHWQVKGISPRMRAELESFDVPTDLVEYVLEDGQGNFRALICVPDLLLKVDPEASDDVRQFVQEMG